jgi:hypothetical protein
MATAPDPDARFGSFSDINARNCEVRFSSVNSLVLTA